MLFTWLLLLLLLLLLLAQISLWRGDITTLGIDAIVNAANKSLVRVLLLYS